MAKETHSYGKRGLYYLAGETEVLISQRFRGAVLGGSDTACG
jgi:hypothetical protein